MPELDDFRIFDHSAHMLFWLGDEPFKAIRTEIESGFARQDPGCSVESIKCSGQPYFLTGARKDPDDPSRVILSRMGVAFQTAVVVITSGAARVELDAVCSIVGTNLDDPENTSLRLDFDIPGDLAEASEALKVKLYESGT